MFYVSEIQKAAPAVFQTPLQEKAYMTLEHLRIPYERVDTEEAITMEDCIEINKKLDMEMVKTLFLCNRQQTQYYLFITKGDKKFQSKEFSASLGISRVSFAPADKMMEILGTKIGAATIFSMLEETARDVSVVFDRDVLQMPFYGCSDGTTTGYMKIETRLLTEKFLPYTKHSYVVAD